MATLFLNLTHLTDGQILTTVDDEDYYDFYILWALEEEIMNS